MYCSIFGIHCFTFHGKLSYPYLRHLFGSCRGNEYFPLTSDHFLQALFTLVHAEKAMVEPPYMEMHLAIGKISGSQDLKVLSPRITHVIYMHILKFKRLWLKASNSLKDP